MQFREVEEFEARALAGLPATSGWSAIPEHLAPPSGPVGLGEGERRNRPLPLRSESGLQRVGARTPDWPSPTAGLVQTRIRRRPPAPRATPAACPGAEPRLTRPVKPARRHP